jgi:hypothetical protein
MQSTNTRSMVAAALSGRVIIPCEMVKFSAALK